MLKDKAEHAYLQFFIGPRDLNVVRQFNKNLYGNKTGQTKSESLFAEK